MERRTNGQGSSFLGCWGRAGWSGPAGAGQDHQGLKAKGLHPDVLSQAYAILTIPLKVRATTF